MEELADKEKIDEQLLRSHAEVDDIEANIKAGLEAFTDKQFGQAAGVRVPAAEKDSIRDISYTKGPYNFSEANEFGLITR
jgi:hypothetical protein